MLALALRERHQQSVAPQPARRPQAASRPPARHSARAASHSPVRRLRVGQQVEYRQGRGTFTAKVVSIDDKNGTAVLERAEDKKRVERPLTKVYARSLFRIELDAVSMAPTPIGVPNRRAATL